VPTYTYQCKECGHSFDLFHNINAKPRVKCPKCEGKCTRLIGCGAGIIFKGSGFYQTDYKNGGNAVTSSKKVESKSETKGDSSGGSKTAASAK
jgi:putative FmdB family regulatory protein